MLKPQLSIIIPAYNCGKSITKIVNSILRQSYTDFELIIINDKSVDDTARVINKLAQTDQRIQIIHQTKNSGAAVARNTGIDRSQGKYLMFFDADDDIVPNALMKFIKAIEQPGVELAVSGMTINTIVSGKQVASVDVCLNQPPARKAKENFRLYVLRLLGMDGRLYQVWNKIYLASIIKTNQIKFQPGVNFGEDLLFNLEYFSLMTGKIKFITQPLYTYNQSSDSGTFSQSSLGFANREQNYSELIKFTNSLPGTITKISLLSWIKFYWFYSYTLAIASSHLTKTEKVNRLAKASNFINHTPISAKSVIGGKKVLVEKTLQKLSSSPKLLLSLTGFANRIKNSATTTKLWQRLKP